MLKYIDAKVVFTEVPDEITLAINISNCPCQCGGCHSPHLAEDIGEILSINSLFRLIEGNKGISCISFMGGDSDPKKVDFLALMVRKRYPELKVAWYSGKQELSKYINLRNFDIIKLGPYIEELGPLNSKNTNQRFYRIENKTMIDETYKFWKHETEN